MLLGTAWAYQRFNRPLPAPTFVAGSLGVASEEPKIAWPAYGQVAVGTVEDGLLAQSNVASAAPLPTASLAKVVTALTVLDKKPLAPGQQGPDILLTVTDEALYHSYIAKGGSVSGVTAGKTITEYQALQTIMLPSSNNMAETLTNWAFGSQEAYRKAAEAYTKKHGLSSTIIADASGFSSDTRSTAVDLVKIGILAMKQPVLSEIVAQPSATIPVAGIVNNVNRLLGVDGIVGIKTGNTDQAGGCYLVASRRVLSGGHSRTLLVAIMGAPTLARALADSRPLLNQVASGFSAKTIVTAGQQLGIVKTTWGSQSAALAQDNITIFGWNSSGATLTTQPRLEALHQGASVGSATVSKGVDRATISMYLSDPLRAPSTSWRLKHIF
jgi:D-alanyl-D-alanine carboxypeptidase (penicillin-binding protein 5/6)